MNRAQAKQSVSVNNKSKNVKEKIMNLDIDFYSKEEASIQMGFADPCPFEESKTNELFLFAWFT